MLTPTPTPAFYHWRIETAHFSFDAYAASAAECRYLMARAWSVHQQQTGATYALADISDGERPRPVTLSTVYRDGKIIPGL